MLTLDPDASVVENALTLAKLCRASCADNPADDPSFRQTDWDTLRAFAFPGCAGFVCSNEKNTVLVFRGDAGPPDWAADLPARLAQAPGGGYAHRGFQGALLGGWFTVAKLVLDQLTPGKSLWVTGHGRGAALAVLAADRFWNVRAVALDQQRPVTTFGQPRVGDQEYWANYTLKVNRFVNGQDLVAALPPRHLPGCLDPLKFYADFGTLFHFDSRGRLLVGDSAAHYRKLLETTTAVNALTGRRDELEADVAQGVQDHALDRYIECLEKNQP